MFRWAGTRVCELSQAEKVTNAASGVLEQRWCARHPPYKDRICVTKITHIMCDCSNQHNMSNVH